MSAKIDRYEAIGALGLIFVVVDVMIWLLPETMDGPTAGVAFIAGWLGFLAAWMLLRWALIAQARARRR